MVSAARSRRMSSSATSNGRTAVSARSRARAPSTCPKAARIYTLLTVRPYMSGGSVPA